MLLRVGLPLTDVPRIAAQSRRAASNAARFMRDREYSEMNPIKRLLEFNSSRYRLRQENADFAASVPTGALVLDAGAGEAPYKCLFQHAIYESADFQKVNKLYAKSTYVCDLKNIPVEDQRFDFIVFNQVMEHLPEPSIVLAELHRILKENGKLIYTGPLFYEEHEQPYDFYRYTQFGLRHLFTTAGSRLSSSAVAS